MPGIIIEMDRQPIHRMPLEDFAESLWWVAIVTGFWPY